MEGELPDFNVLLLRSTQSRTQHLPVLLGPEEERLPCQRTTADILCPFNGMHVHMAVSHLFLHIKLSPVVPVDY